YPAHASIAEEVFGSSNGPRERRVSGGMRACQDSSNFYNRPARLFNFSAKTHPSILDGSFREAAAGEISYRFSSLNGPPKQYAFRPFQQSHRTDPWRDGNVHAPQGLNPSSRGRIGIDAYGGPSRRSGRTVTGSGIEVRGPARN